MKRWVYFIFVLLLSLKVQHASGTIRLQNGLLYNTETNSTMPYKAVSMWYASLLGESKKENVRQRLVKELDFLQQMGVNVVEVLAGVQVKCIPAQDSTQNAHGIVHTLVSEKSCFRGMDFLLSELKQRNMWAVINLDRSPCYDLQRQRLYGQFVEKWLTHKNALTNVAYIDDANILAWKVCDDTQTGGDSLQLYTAWVQQCVERIKQTDKEHLVMASFQPLRCEAENDAKALSTFTSETGVDCVEVALSPCAQGWINWGSIIEGMPHVFLQLDDRLTAYNRTMSMVERPYIVSVEYPRDAHFTRPGTSCSARNTFYEYVGLRANECRSNSEAFVGLSIKGWGGMAKPNSLGVWNDAAEFTSEYADEMKGEYSVFNADEQTIDLLTKQFKQE